MKTIYFINCTFNKLKTEEYYMKDIATRYFEYWNNQDLDGLRSLFAKDVSLKDWEIDVAGIDGVIEANAKIFKDVPGIKAEIVKLVFDQDSIFGQLVIHLTENENISVVDVLSIENNKIKRIHAYKC